MAFRIGPFYLVWLTWHKKLDIALDSTVGRGFDVPQTALAPGVSYFFPYRISLVFQWFFVARLSLGT